MRWRPACDAGGLSRRHDDRGSGTALAIALIAVVVLAAAVVGMSAAAHTASVRAQGVADVAVLAAALEARDVRARGHSVVGAAHRICGVAGEVAARNNASLVDCDVAPGGSVTVHVEVTHGAWTVMRGARAGTGDK